ncbi:MAG: LacI family DNA-binding transcriptional regulator [Nitriliruptoraceae bacterium]
MSATIEDVARAARVSVATVSRALRGLPNVAPSTRARVVAVATELEYVADPRASRLAGGRRMVIGLVVPMLGQWYYAKLFSGVEAVATISGYDVLPLSTSGPGGVERFVEQLPFRKRVDGLVLADAQFDEEQFQVVKRGGVPLVTLGSHTPGVWGLAVDNVAAARLAVGHLTGLGHARIALIGGIEDDPFRFSVPVDRFEGYQEALAAAGLEHDPDLVVPGNFSAEGGAEAMHALLTLRESPTAVFACSDEMAIGAMQVARDAGIRIPEDLSVIGIDDHDLAAYVGLTTIRQDVIGQGERVAQLLLDRIAQTEGVTADVHEVHPTRLVVRRTTAAPPPGRRRERGVAD